MRINTNKHSEIDIFGVILIEKYGFGHIRVNGKDYHRDIIILPDGKIIDNWWRKEGHRFQLEDLKPLLNMEMQYLVLGTGYFGIVKVDKEVIEYFKSKGINVIVKNSREAVKEYNSLVKKGYKTALAIHLTC